MLETLNPEQRRAVLHGLPGHAPLPEAAHEPQDDRAVLVLAGAGTGKTATLSARVAALLHRGLAPERILLLTFSRRAASEMIRRAGILSRSAGPGCPAGRLVLPWAGTFHSVASRLLRQRTAAFGLDPGFTILDRADAVELLDWLREQQGLRRNANGFRGPAPVWPSTPTGSTAVTTSTPC
ncbi:MAG: UvrD-helicase domain-containing protein [Burkholderiaceae bacterium]